MKAGRVGTPRRHLLTESYFQGNDLSDLDWLYSGNPTPEQSLWYEVVRMAILDAIDPPKVGMNSYFKEEVEIERIKLKKDAMDYLFHRNFRCDFHFACSVIHSNPKFLMKKIRDYVKSERAKPEGERLTTNRAKCHSLV